MHVALPLMLTTELLTVYITIDVGQATFIRVILRFAAIQPEFEEQIIRVVTTVCNDSYSKASNNRLKRVSVDYN